MPRQMVKHNGVWVEIPALGPTAQQMQYAAAAAVPDALAAADFGPYVGPVVDAHIAEDPGFTAAAEVAVTNEIAGRDLVETTDTRLPQIVSTDDYLFVGVDENRVFSDLVFRKSDGQVDDTVMARWAGRIAALIGVQPEATRIYAETRYSPDSDIWPANADLTRVAGWGSSTMSGFGGALLTGWATGKGATYYNGGESGDSLWDTLARLGSHPARLTGTIPATGSVVLTLHYTQRSLKTFTGTVAGIHGTLSGTGYGNTTNATFTRTDAGTETVVSDEPFVPDDGHEYRDAVTILNLGKNSISGGDPTRDEQIIAATQEAFDWLAPLVKKCLVMGHFANASWNTGTPTESWQQVQNVNAAYAERYGPLFIDLAGYLAGADVWTHTGITPTATDLAQQSRMVKPDSLSADDGHLNTAGYQAVMDYLIGPALDGTGWWA